MLDDDIPLSEGAMECGRHEEVHGDVRSVVEIDEIRAFCHRLRTRARAARPGIVVQPFDPAIGTVIRVIEHASVGCYGEACGDPVDVEAFGPVAVACVTRAGDQVFGEFEHGP